MGAIAKKPGSLALVVVTATETQRQWRLPTDISRVQAYLIDQWPGAVNSTCESTSEDNRKNVNERMDASNADRLIRIKISY